jgi:hypothetical protein
MGRNIMKMDAQSNTEKTCACSKIPSLVHELNQSLTIIYAYVNGCSERLKENSLDNKVLFDIFNKINKQTEIMKDKIHKIAK